MREHFTYDSKPDSLRISYRWMNSGSLISKLLFFLVVTYFVSKTDFQFLVIFVILLAVYQLVLISKNSTTITIDQNKLTIKHGPIPSFKRSVTIPKMNIKQIVIQNSKSDEGEEYELKAILNNQQHITIVPSSYKTNKAELINLEKSINSFFDSQETKSTHQIKHNDKLSPISEHSASSKGNPFYQENKERPEYFIKELPDLNHRKVAPDSLLQSDDGVKNILIWRNGDTDIEEYHRSGQIFHYLHKNHYTYFDETKMSNEKSVSLLFNFDFHPFSLMIENEIYDLDKYRFNKKDDASIIKQWTYIDRTKEKMIRVVLDGMAKYYWEGIKRKSEV